MKRRVRADGDTRIIRTSAPLTCGPGCGILAHVRDGVLVKVEPGDFPETGHLCARGMAYPQWVYHPDRLKYPMKRVGERGEGRWERISWEEALETTGTRFRQIGHEYGSPSVAWMVGGGALGALTASAVMGAAGACGGTFVLPLGMGDSAGPTGDKIAYGTALALGERYTVNFEKPELIVVWGNNPAETDFFKWRRLMKAREAGARVVVIDPRFTVTASKADEYIPIKPGTDPALALGMLNVIVNSHLEDTSFLESRTVGPFLVRSENGHFLREKDTASGDTDNYMIWDTASGTAKTMDTDGVVTALTGEYRVEGITCKPAFQLLANLVREYPPERVYGITGIPAETITRLALEYAERKPAASYRGMGLQRTFHGDHSWRAISTLAAVTGNISFEGYGGFEPNYAAFMTLGIPNLLPVLNLYEAVVDGRPYPVKAVWLARHNMVNQLPDYNTVTTELLPRLDFIAVAEMFMSVSAQYADIVLPACSFLECNDVVVPAGLGTHDYMQLQQKAIEPLYESRSDFDMLAGLVRAMGIEGFMERGEEESIRMVLDSGHPTMEGITVERLREGPALPSHGMPDFKTPSGRLEFYSEQLVEFEQALPLFLQPVETGDMELARKYPLVFFSTHTRYRGHSQFANVPWSRALDPEPVLEMNPVNAVVRGIEDGDMVRVFNNRGEFIVKARLNEGISPGVVNTCQGWSPWDHIAGTHQNLTHEALNPVQQAVYEPNTAYYDVRVDVEKVEKG